MAERRTFAKEKEREGIVVWDQRGVVVMWPDGHASRFSWETLQHLRLCAECHTHNPRLPPVSHQAPQFR